MCVAIYHIDSYVYLVAAMLLEVICVFLQLINGLCISLMKELDILLV